MHRPACHSRSPARFRRLALLALTLVVCPGFSEPARGADKSGVSLQSVSLPGGPGSLYGLGGEFEPDLPNGAASYAVPILVPGGSNDMAPELVLRYASGAGNGILGFGWELGLPFVKRRDERPLPRYLDGPDEEDRFASDEHDSPEGLVRRADGYYFGEREGPYLRYARVEDYWVGTLPDGLEMIFGKSPEARIEDAATGRIYQWDIEEERDVHGNTVRYIYAPGAGPENQNRNYLLRIEYGAGAPPWDHFHFVGFEYEERPDWFESCRPGFPVRMGRRLSAIHVCTQGVEMAGHASGDFNNDGEIDYLNRRYVFGYDPHPHWSLLGSVTMYGADGESVLAPLTMEYTLCNPAPSLSVTDFLRPAVNVPLVLFDKDYVEITDLNGDALPDLLKTGPFGGMHIAYMNQGEQGEEKTRALHFADGVPIGGDARVYGVNLSEDAGAPAHLQDMDGDGRADLVYTASTFDVFYFSAEVIDGQPAWGERRSMNPLRDQAAPPSPFDADRTEHGDLNGDDLGDIFQSVYEGGRTAIRVWLNLGGDRFAPFYTVPQHFSFHLGEEGVFIADFNGDELPDIVRTTETMLEVAPGLGYGHFGELVQVAIPGGNFLQGEVAFEDLNGDGLDDLVILWPVANSLHYYLNLGNYTLDQRRIIRDLPGRIAADSAFRIADMNGNGTADLVCADRMSGSGLWIADLGAALGCVPAPNLLTRVDNGIGKTMRLVYKTTTDYALADAASGRPWQDPIPSVVEVVSGIIIEDSLGGEYETRFEYNEGVYNRLKRLFIGFEKVAVFDLGDETAPTRVDRHTFDTGREQFALRGSLLEQSVEDEDGTVYFTEKREYAVPLWFTGVSGIDVVAPYESVLTRTLIEGGTAPPKTVRTETVQDDFGNVIELREWGIVEGEDYLAGNDERITRMEYALNETSWIIRNPSRIAIFDGEDTPITRSLFFYDDETYSAENYGALSRGNQTLEVAYYDLEDPEGYVLTDRAKYDAYGNTIAALDELAEAPGGVIDDDTGHYRSFAYDPFFHTYPIEETIHVGGGAEDLVVEAEYDYGLGTVLASVDFNGLRTHYSHDSFARLISTMRPGDQEGFPSLEYRYIQSISHGDGVINYVESRVLDSFPGSKEEKDDHYFIYREYMDGMGRLLMKREEAEPDPDTGAPRVAVTEAKAFHGRAGVAFEISPYFESLPDADLGELLDYRGISDEAWTGLFLLEDALESRGLLDAPRVAYSYDPLLREIEMTNPDGTIRRQRHEPLIIYRYDENDTDPASPFFDTPLVHHSDGLGRLVRVDEIVRLKDDGTRSDEQVTWTTRYTYRADGPLMSMTDAQGNIRRYGFDALQTFNFIDDPNRGQRFIETDNVGNTAAIEDATGRRIEFTYDGVNRPLTMDFLDEGESFSAGYGYDPESPLGLENRPDVVYGYDSALAVEEGVFLPNAPGEHSRGLPSYVLYPHGEYHYGYTPRGDLAWRLHRIADPLNDVLVEYRMEMSYDPAGRVVTLDYPDGDRVAYQYSARGHTARIEGGADMNAGAPSYLFEALDFGPAGQRLGARFGNGVMTGQGFDIRGRLSRTSAVKTSPEFALLDMVYAYDGVSNILAIEDMRPGTVREEGHPLRNSQYFSYDDLDRLVEAVYSFALPGESRSDDAFVRYRHDRIGNLLEQRSDWIQEDRGQPVANLGTMDYGGEGGAQGRDGRAPGDSPGPEALSRIENNGEIREFLYDDAGNMQQLDDLLLTWNFRNQLAVAEDDGMRTEYWYDHSGKRVAKLIWTRDSGGFFTGAPSRYVHYVDANYEVREFDQAVKYVFDSEGSRIARITGMLDSTALRRQSFRIQEGWNFYSMGVSAPDAALQFGIGSNEALKGAFLFDPELAEYSPLSGDSPLPGGSLFWIYSETPGIAVVRGTPFIKEENEMLAQTGFISVGAFESLPLASLLDDGVDLVWLWEPSLDGWTARFGGDMAFLSNAPDFVRPGQPVYLRVTGNIPLSLPPASASIEYYLKDHLGSAAVLSDGAGNVTEERTYHPYGAPRFEYRARPETLPNPYQFAEKERDTETSLHYFEARYVAATLARFLSPDPLSDHFPDDYLADPQMQAAYGFARSNPLVYEDPTGLLLQTALAKKKIASLNPFADINVSSAKLGKAERIAEVFGKLNVAKGGTFPQGPDLGGIRIPGFAQQDIDADLEQMFSPEKVISKIAQAAENLKNAVPQKGKDKIDVDQFLNLFTKERPFGPLEEGVNLTAGGRVIRTGKELGLKISNKEILKQLDTFSTFEDKFKELKGIAESKGFSKTEFKFDTSQAASFIEKYLKPISGELFETSKDDSDDDDDSD